MPPALPQPKACPVPPAPARHTALRAAPRPRAAIPRATSALEPMAAVSASLRSDKSGGELAAARDQIRMWIENHTGRLRPDFDDRWEDAEEGVRRLRFTSRRSEIEAVSRSAGDARYFAAALTLRSRSRRIVTRTIISVFGVAGAARIRLTLLVPPQPSYRRAHAPWSPALIGRLARHPGLADYGFPVRSEPWIVSTRSEVDEFIRLLTHPGRTRPVFATGLDADETDPRKAILDSDELQQRTTGLSHVVVLTGPMTFVLTDQVGRRFSVFGNAFRTYRPGCILDRDSDMHPMALGETMATWAPGGNRQFLDTLQREGFSTSVKLQADPGHRLPFRARGPDGAGLRIGPPHRLGADSASHVAEHATTPFNRPR